MPNLYATTTTATTSTSATNAHVGWRFSNSDHGRPREQSPSTERLRERIRDDVVDFALLGCTPDDPPDKVRREWRRLAHLHHPDHGGDAETFRRIREAYARLRRAGKG